MEAILPFKIKNEQKFYESALKVGYNEMEIYKFIYVMQQSDLDIFPKMQDERINVLIYGWELCEDYKQKLSPDEWELPEEMETILKLLVPWSLDIWFSKEWDKCKYLLKSALIHCLNRARDLLMRMPDMMQINWDFLLLYNLKPWNVLYLKSLTVTKEKTLENGAQSIETEELPATDEDISYVKLEQLPIIVLRLVKIFDQSSIDMVKTLCMRVIAAWNKIHQGELETSGSRRPYIPPEDKRCLLLICHIYLMAVYEADDVKGYVIDNMINNIRFYYQGFQNSTPLHAMDNLEYTPARFIALTNFHLRVQKRDFFDFFIWNKYDTSLVNLFGVVSQAYKSYLLGNLLMELNNMNEDDFASNIPLYKRLMNSYVNEREKSEIFLINELDKIKAQCYAHNIIQTVKNVTDFKSKICKGNRMSNIGNYENSDDTVAPLIDPTSINVNLELKVDEINEEVVEEDIEDERERIRSKESELRLDPIFQNLPHNESILYYVYDVLAKKDYKGWHFAKVVLLVKIIGREQNMVETWRYHPGLTTDFMLNLEVKLSHHFVDLAKIFKDHPFLEQEFWLTAFYLNPTSELYETIKRLGMRNNRKRTDEHTKLVMNIDNIEAKYGLLSSTIDVKELASMSNTDDPITDYEPLFSALHSLRVPDSLVKDMLTAIFLPRNRSFAWAVDWVILRNRCKMIMTSLKEKKRFVDLNMAEANERLKYLIIDYEKYKNRPQLDYGTIEAGYENLMSGGEFDKESEEEEEEEEEDFEDDEDIYENKKRGRGTSTAAARKKEDEKVEDDNSQEDDPFLMGKRRTRARTAATLASFLFQTLPRSSRRKKNQKPPEDENKNEEEKTIADNEDKSSDSKSPTPKSESRIPSPLTPSCEQDETQIVDVPTKNIKECLKERPMYLNTTNCFQNLIDIWDVEKSDLQSIDENCVSLMESATILQIAAKFKLLNKEINPLGCDENEYIDDKEMIIHNAEFAIKKEYISNVVEVENLPDETEETNNIGEAALVMEVDDNELNAENNEGGKTNNIVKENDESDMQVPLESPVEIVTEHETAETDQSKELPPAEENSSDTINSDMSTAAHKVSTEPSESNKEIYSKRYSMNSDTEMEDKIIKNDNLSEKSKTGAQQKETTDNENEESTEKELEIGEIDFETEIDQIKISNEKDNTLQIKNKVGEENKTRSTTDENALQNTQLAIPAEPFEVYNENKHEEIGLQTHHNNDATQSKELITRTTITTDSDNFTEETNCEELMVNSNDNAENSLDNESENLEEANNPQEILTHKCDTISVDSRESEDKGTQKVVKETEIREHIINNAVVVDLNETNNSIALTIETHHKKDEVEIAEEKTSDDKDSLTQSQSNESNIILAYSTSENSNESEPTTNETKLIVDDGKTVGDDCKTLADTANDQEKLKTYNCPTVPDAKNDETILIETTEDKIDSHSPVLLLRDIVADSVNTTEGQEITDTETQILKKLCLTKNARILLHKLTPADLTHLRQPKIKIQRMNYEKYAVELRAKRRCIEGKVYIDFDDSSNSNHSYGANTSSSEAYHPTRLKRKVPIRRHSLRQQRASESDNESNNSDDYKLSTIIAKSRKRRLSTPSTSQSSTSLHVTGPKSARKSGPKSVRVATGPRSSKKNLVVTPRSASGLKLRIFNAEQNRQAAAEPSFKRSRTIVYDEVIQLSSSSDECVVNDLTVIEEEIIEIEDHPLFEEEIII